MPFTKILYQWYMCNKWWLRNLLDRFWAYVQAELELNPLALPVPPRQREKINWNYCLHTSLWCFKWIYEGLKGLHKIFWGTTEKCENLLSKMHGAVRVKHHYFPYIRANKLIFSTNYLTSSCIRGTLVIKKDGAIH